ISSFPMTQATFTTSNLPIGTDHLTAVYAGDNNYLGSSSSAVTETINPPPPRPTATSLVSSPSPSLFGQSVTVTATTTASGISDLSGATDTLLVDGTPAQTASVNASGVATFHVSGLTTGNHTFEVDYSSGNSWLLPSSAVGAQTVAPATPQLSLDPVNIT